MVQPLKKALVVELAEMDVHAEEPLAADGAGGEEGGEGGIERNAGGSEEAHSADPELWNIGGTEMDLNAKYKVGKQMWYLQSRAKDAIRDQKPIAGSPFNQKAKDAKRLFAEDD
jgi:hypothetical protein